MSDSWDDVEDFPSSKLEQARALEALATAVAAGRKTPQDVRYYISLRDALRSDSLVWENLPPFIRVCRTTGHFWAFIKSKFPTYHERRVFISSEFLRTFDLLERQPGPADAAVGDALSNLSNEAVTKTWHKALARVEADPEGAITLARTLLESTLKLILERHSVDYVDTSDLNDLYAKSAKLLSLAPSDHEAEPIRRILGSLQNLVNGLGTLRNRLSDAHGRGEKVPARPSPRHARLAVNSAGAAAAFLCETCLQREETSKRS
jgi:hypothetical protein